MLTVLVGTIFFKPKPIGWFRSSESFPLTVTIVYPLFMNHIITGDERNVKNLETQVYVSWGMSFKDGQISSQKVNLKHTLLSADNATYAIRQPSERRIWSGTLPQGELSAATRRPLKGRIKRCCINQLYIYLTLITSTFSYFCSEETSKGCAVHRCYANLKHTERRIWSGTLPPATEKPLVP